MTKRLSLWNQRVTTPDRRTSATESNDSPATPSAAPARFYAKHPGLLSPVQPEPEPEPEPQPEPEPTPLEAGSWEAQGVPEPLPRDVLPDRRRGKKPRRVPRHKTRRHAVSVAVSEEEERILRTYAAGLDKSFSEWARSVLFRAMGRRVPSRRGKDE